MTKDELQARLTALMVEHFEIPRERIRPEARLYDDLDIDSIDAVDMIVQLRPLLGKRLQPDVFKSVVTVQDVVDALHRLVHDGAAA
jgi:acyl carrier protein